MLQRALFSTLTPTLPLKDRLFTYPKACQGHRKVGNWLLLRVRKAVPRFIRGDLLESTLSRVH